MLTAPQIQRAAQRNGIGVQAQERDYIQHVLLWLTYSQRQPLAFTGGTALRVIYGGNRYSEELDFDCPEAEVPVSGWQGLWEKTVAGLSGFGIAAEMRNEWESQERYTFEVSYRGPLFDGRERSEGRVRVGVNREPDAGEVKQELVTSAYDDVRPFVVTVLTPEHLLAEKIRAVMLWGKPQDLYDLWLMLRLGMQPEHKLIERKLARHGMHWRLRGLVDSLDSVQLSWERDLRHLLPQYVPYEVVKDGIVAQLVGVPARSRQSGR